MRKPLGWLVAFNIIGFTLMISLMLIWIMTHSDSYQRRRAQSAVLSELKKLGIPALPASAIVTRGSEESTLAEKVMMLTFEAPPEAIRAWLRQGKDVLVPDDSQASLPHQDGVLKYRLISPLGYPLGSCLTFDEQKGRVDVSLTKRSLSL